MFRRELVASPYRMETVRPIEIPVIALVKRHLSEGHFVEGVTLAYQTALLDLQRAYRAPFPPHWTHRDVLQWTQRNNLGQVPDLLRKLYHLYEPVRYGRPLDVVRGDVLSPLTSLYAQSPLWQLYAAPYPRAPDLYAEGYGFDSGYWSGEGAEGRHPWSQGPRALPPP